MSLPRPTVTMDTSWRFPAPAEHLLDNGLRLWLFDLPNQHVVSATLVLDAPLAAEPEHLDGIAAITVRTSDEGTRGHPGSTISEAIEDQGVVYSGAVTRSATMVQFDVPSTRLGAALPLVDEIIETASFDAADVERQIALRQAEIDYAHTHPASLVQLGFHQTIYDPTTRDGRPAGGQLATLAAISPGDVVGYHDTWWQPQGATLVVAGALPEDIVEQIAASFGGWQPRPTPARPGTIGLTTPGSRVWVIDQPDAAQTEIRLGCVAPDRSDPRWAALDVAATAMGGSFGSRLNHVLREERGYTYGAHADFHPRDGIGIFTTSASCRHEVAVAAVREALGILDLSGQPLGDEEIIAARNHLIGIAPLQFQTADAITDQAASLAACRIPAEWVNDHQARVAGVSAEQANEAFTSVVQPTRVNIVMCGPADTLCPELETLGMLAEVVELTR